MSLFSRSREEEVDKKTLLKKIALGKLNYLGKKKFNKKTIDDIYWILKIFFKNYFNISKELTYTELIEKIKKKRIDNQIKERVINIFNFFLDIKYKEKQYTTKDLRNIVRKAKDVIRIISKPSTPSSELEEKKEKFGFFGKIGKPNQEEPEVTRKKEEKTRKEKGAERLEEKERGKLEAKRKRGAERLELKEERRKPKKKFEGVRFIEQRIYEARSAIADLDLRRARHIYVSIMASYKDLKDKDKARIYDSIKELYENIKALYEERKHAEALSKYSK